MYIRTTENSSGKPAVFLRDNFSILFQAATHLLFHQYLLKERKKEIKPTGNVLSTRQCPVEVAAILSGIFVYYVQSSNIRLQLPE